MPLNKRPPLGSPLLAAIDATLPLQYRPPGKIILRQLGEYRPKTPLPLAGRTKPPRSIYPRLIAPVNALPPARTKLRILYMKHLDPFVIQIDELQIIELLQHEMAGIKKYIASRMLAHALQKHFKRHSVMQIFARMNLKTQIHSRLIECIQNGTPPRRQFLKRRFN